MVALPEAHRDRLRADAVRRTGASLGADHDLVDGDCLGPDDETLDGTTGGPA